MTLILLKLAHLCVLPGDQSRSRPIPQLEGLQLAEAVHPWLTRVIKAPSFQARQISRRLQAVEYTGLQAETIS